MNHESPTGKDYRPTSASGEVTEKLRRSRQRLLDLTLRNRLLNFRPGAPSYRDDQKGHKHTVFKGQLESIWQALVQDEKPVEIAYLTREQQEQLSERVGQAGVHTASDLMKNSSLAALGQEDWTNLLCSLRGPSQFVQKGNLLSLLPSEAFRKRLTKIRNQQNTLANSTGDSALFLAMGFLEWCESEPHSKANESLFAPLILVHVCLDQRRLEGGGEREFFLQMDADQPQGNPCLAEKLSQDFAIGLPEIRDEEAPSSYLDRVGRAVRSKPSWKVNSTVALGFFNFARYRLWLDLDTMQWPHGQSPVDHPIVSAVLDGAPLLQRIGIPSADDVATHQATDDLPIVMDADSTQYATLLAGQRGVSMVVQGPPGSGKSQTITNLIAVSIAQGKRVLFVAQKLPALQVVRRRLESVNLAPFCLPLFSDKARVTEVHKHLATSAWLRETKDSPRPPDNQVSALARKLNGYSSRLRTPPTGFQQSTCALLQTAAALQLVLRETWGKEWDDELLSITPPIGEASPDWIGEREQVLHQWHHLKAEVGGAWSDWAPLRLGALDTQLVEAIVRQQKCAAGALDEGLRQLPEDFHLLPVGKIEELVAELGNSRFTVLSDVLPSLLAFLWDSPSNHALVARLEQDLEEYYCQLSKAQSHLRITQDNHDYVASRVADAIRSVVSVVSPRCSLAFAMSSLCGLNDLLPLAKELAGYASLNPNGISSIWPTIPSTTDTACITWRQVETLANHVANPDLSVPTGGKIMLARYVQDNNARKSEATALARSIAHYHACVARLNTRFVGAHGCRPGTASRKLEQSIHCLCHNSLSAVRICQLDAMEETLLSLVDSIRKIASQAQPDFCAAIFGYPAMRVADLLPLAKLNQISPERLQTPTNEHDHLLPRLLGYPNPVATLQSFAKAIDSHQIAYDGSANWFSGILPGQPVARDLLKSQRESVRKIQELGLAAQPLWTLAHTAEKVARLRKATENLLAELQIYFEPWPLLQPETLEQVVQAKKLFSLLLSRPQVPPELPVYALCVQSNTELISAALAESRDLQLFRDQHSDRVAFQDLPKVETLTALRRELRSFAGCWWRWFSEDYHRTRKKMRAFLKKPFPADADALALFDQLEFHERRQAFFMGAPAGPVLGGLFRGINTNWSAIEPTLAWIQTLQAATQSSDVSAFVETATCDAVGLRAVIKSIEVLMQLIDQYRQELQPLGPLSFLSSKSETFKLEELRVALVRTDKLLNDLRALISTQVELQPQATFNELDQRIARLEQLHQTALDLREYAALAEPVVAASLSPTALANDAVWLLDLDTLNLAPNLFAAILQKRLLPANHQPLFQAANNFNQRIRRMQEMVATPQPPPWLAPTVVVTDLEGKFSQLLDATSAVRLQLTEFGFNERLTFGEVQELFDNLQEVESAVQTFDRWREILHEDPSLLLVEHITTTVEWLDALRQHGAVGSLLNWILEEETEKRLAWWQNSVLRAKEVRSRSCKLVDSFSFPLHGTQSDMTLIAWSSETAEQIVRAKDALQIIETHSQSTSLSIHDIDAATIGLKRALQLNLELELWHARLGVEPTGLELSRIQNHRQWSATVRGISPALGNWLTTTQTSSRSRTLLGIVPRLDALKLALKQTNQSLEVFGRVFGTGPCAVLSMQGNCLEIEQNCDAFISRIPLLPSYAALLREQDRAEQLGLAKLLTHSASPAVTVELILQTFRGAVAFQQARAIWDANDELRSFQSTEHERLRSKFQNEDDKQLKTNREFIKACLSGAGVTGGSRGRTVGEHTEYALLLHEMGKQRRHLPIRRLVHRAGRAMMDLCPCWMMTPLAVAQFLPPEAIGFDLVIMDEASQINPEDAWGAISRGRQLVVVGDQKQMPPSDFFMSTLEEDESPDEEIQIDGGKSESILDASVSSLLSSSLLWHYRSRHEALIAPANSFSYENRLILFPHPHRHHPELGLRYTLLPNATTTVGKVVNALEATAVATRVRELVLQQYAKPAQKRLTLGVVTMNIYQQDAIMEVLTSLRDKDRPFDLAMSSLASEQNEEPLFVRNLENIQGDERDIMILSCTYGPQTAGGTPTQRFGPLNRQGGERRFNVLITRAKWRMEIFSSIRSDQILVDGKQQGVRDFHLFLKYAESGVLADPGVAAFKPPESLFVAQVEAVLQRASFQTERQVGVAGCFIDLAIRHPKNPSLFALGVECDGKTYHSSRAARDRDRLREKVLIERGWKLIRIWSNDWFVNPIQARKKLLEAVAAACQ